MGRAKGLLLLCAVLIAWLWLGWPGAASAQFKGSYTAIGPLPEAGSVKVVAFDEYLNFSCPHCNNFRKAAKPLKKKYGKRLKITYFPLLFQGQTDEVARFFFLAQAAGRTEEIIKLIFEASFDNGVNVHDPKVVSYLARTSGLGEAYRNGKDAKWVTDKVNAARQSAAVAGIRATPTVVLQGALKVEPESKIAVFVQNIDGLISQLLGD